MTTEREFQEELLELLAYTGWSLRYHTFDSRRSGPGFPDIVAVRPPRVIFAELKTNEGRVRPEQAAWLQALWACPGAEAYLWRPRDIDQIAAVLSREFVPGRARSDEVDAKRASVGWGNR